MTFLGSLIPLTVTILLLMIFFITIPTIARESFKNGMQLEKRNMSKLYIIIKIGYEYNDETYYEAGYGKPSAVFQDLNKAETHLRETAIKDILDSAKYGSLPEAFNSYDEDEEIEQSLAKIMKINDFSHHYYCEHNKYKTMTREQAEQIYDEVKPRMYEVVEVEQE